MYYEIEMQTKFNVGDKVVLKSQTELGYYIKAISASSIEDAGISIHYKLLGVNGWVPEDAILANIKYESTY